MILSHKSHNVNRPKAMTMENYQRDGPMRFDGNEGGKPNYYPNSFGGPEPLIDAEDPPFDVSGKAGHHEYTHPNDDFVQAGTLFRKVMTAKDRDHLIGNIVTHLCHANKDIQIRQTKIFYKADPEYGRRVAEGLKLDLKQFKQGKK